MQCSVITGTGSYIPPEIQSNEDFFQHVFYTDKGHQLDTTSAAVVEKFRQITGISNRRYAPAAMHTSDLAAAAASAAIKNSLVDAETLDQVIVAHNFGNVNASTVQMDAMPSLASRVKHQLGIANAGCVAYDILFGCPGWIQGLIQADAFFKAGLAKKCLIIGAETLSRVIDMHDRDSMIFADGAGACVLEYREVGDSQKGILSSSTKSHTVKEYDYIDMGKSNNPDADARIHYMKMKGRKVYDYAIEHVPLVMKECFDKCGLPISQLKKVFIHQANKKMDEGIVQAFFRLYGIEELPPLVMPMSIHWLGNSSVATVPTLFDLVVHNKVEKHQLHNGDVIIFVSVGAGMNINAVCYRC